MILAFEYNAREKKNEVQSIPNVQKKFIAFKKGIVTVTNIVRGDDSWDL